MSLTDATEQQRRAARPDASTWLSANAGSGKTKVLIDRVAGLLLENVDPGNILCLTYTKAAASEMQNRLFDRLGGWAMKPDAELSAELRGLGVDGPLGTDRLAEARRLFARAIETPGGLRIQTIHSFCAALLRRFPLEAGVSPQFAEMDEREAELIRAAVVEELAQGDTADVVDALAEWFTGEDFSALTDEILRHREAILRHPGPDEIRRWANAPATGGIGDVVAAAFDGGEETMLRDLLDVLRTSDKPTDLRAAETVRRLLPFRPNAATLGALGGLMLFGASARQPFGAKIGSFPTKGARDRLGARMADLDALMQRVEDQTATLRTLRVALRTETLYRFGAAFISLYTARKQARGFLDFDDLILKTRDLLTDPAVAAWVLYRLDGGIDHILVDEAQDTSPVQWQVIERLAEEMTSGAGAGAEKSRTIFVVGDRKQSIYSFQGADPAEFDRMRTKFAARLAAGPGLQNLILPFSFRSSPAILAAVDITFDNWPPAEGMIEQHHLAINATMPGRVDLWPLVPKTDDPEDGDWFDPVDRVPDDHHDVRLARSIADDIARMIREETLPAKDGRRPVRAGDVMILVQRRSDLFHEIIRACKETGLPVAGADRLKLGGELAVRDLAALLSFLALQEDDLSLASALRSPLFGWSEDDLFRIAHGRPGFLWQALRDREDTHPETLAMLHALRDDADFERPYDLIDRILTRHDGRRRLIARLGPEAEDGIDALLAQALAYERNEVPSLTGFLTWLETDDVEIKRQLDSAGDRIRVMTVHGSKGLESPIVILPDTAKRQVTVRAELLPVDDGGLLWRVPAEDQPETMKQSLSRLKAAQEEERLRLLYVAMTRAENWLIVCGAGEGGKPGESWHGLVAQGLGHAGTDLIETPAGPGRRLSSGEWTGGAVVAPATTKPTAPDLPGWAMTRAAPPVRAGKTQSPSDLGGDKALPGETDMTGADVEAALRRGRQIHLLLEHLPAPPRAQWADYARDLLSVGEDAVDLAEADLLLADVARVLEADGLKPLFGADALAEVNLTATLDPLGGARIHGAVDRLIVRPDRVIAVDYKTNRRVPATPAEVPEGLLRQMGAYADALRQIYPDRPVEAAILWTAEARLMSLPDDMLRGALARAGTS